MSSITRLYTHPDCEIHEMPRHPERPDRLRSVMARLTESGITSETDVVLATEASDDMLSKAHSKTYIETINSSEPDSGVIKVDPDTYLSNGSLRASKLAAGACASATRDVLNGDATRVFCAVRPPGHHAEIAASMGFCLFNNIALAAELALADERINRVAIVDFDVHHCNGTVDIFKDRPEVLVCSSFQEHFYPHRYLDFTNAHILNMPLQKGSTGDLFRTRAEREWLPALEHHKPDVLFISAGFDAHAEDPLGELRFVESDYVWITTQLISIANQ
ncbi:MAG: histone deacetylase family protein, partial [Candidatus Azotimanducaceae bacterium WSBS_2022_MAG_OTU7]